MPIIKSPWSPHWYWNGVNKLYLTIMNESSMFCILFTELSQNKRFQPTEFSSHINISTTIKYTSASLNFPLHCFQTGIQKCIICLVQF